MDGIITVNNKTFGKILHKRSSSILNVEIVRQKKEGFRSFTAINLEGVRNFSSAAANCGEVRYRAGHRLGVARTAEAGAGAGRSLFVLMTNAEPRTYHTVRLI